MHQLRSKRIILTGLAVFAFVLVGTNFVVFAYGTFLGFQARGAPDSQKIARFAAQAVPWMMVIGGILVAFCAAAWTARRVANREALHGLLIAVVAAVLNLIYGIVFSYVAWHDLAAGAAILLAGWLGGLLVRTRKQGMVT